MKKLIAIVVLFCSVTPALAHDKWYDSLLKSVTEAEKSAVETNAHLNLTVLQLQTSNKALTRANDTFIKSIDAKEAEIKAAKIRVGDLLIQNERQAGTIADLENDFFSVRQRALLKWAIAALIVASLLKAMASQNIQIAGFGLGGVFSIVAELIFGVLTGGVSLLSTIFNNLWFRFWSCGESAVAWLGRKTVKGAATVAAAPYTVPAAAVRAVNRKLRKGQKDFDKFAETPVAATELTVFVPEPEPEPEPDSIKKP